MKIGTLVKLGIIVVVAYIAWRWISNNILNSGQVVAPPNPLDYAAPLVGTGPIFAWAPPYQWQPPWQGPRRRRGGPIRYSNYWSTPAGPYP